jgi:hypothetical protein
LRGGLRYALKRFIEADFSVGGVAIIRMPCKTLHKTGNDEIQGAFPFATLEGQGDDVKTKATEQATT